MQCGGIWPKLGNQSDDTANQDRRKADSYGGRSDFLNYDYASSDLLTWKFSNSSEQCTQTLMEVEATQFNCFAITIIEIKIQIVNDVESPNSSESHEKLIKDFWQFYFFKN